MELTLKRTCFTTGTNGTLLEGERFICFTIELAMKGNEPGVSCIPEGRYQLKKRYTRSRGWHLQVDGVPQRSGILIHPANDALTELEGCIAPVSTLTGIGKGLFSKKAQEKLNALVYEVMEREGVFLAISC
ncbi:MAG: DUF5675 family protein [Prolixibacteraceae bacterium]